MFPVRYLTLSAITADAFAKRIFTHATVGHAIVRMFMLVLT